MYKKLLAAAAVAAVLACGALTAGAADYYVSNSLGNDDNDGLSDNTPWKTLEKVSSAVFQPGDNIYLKSGDVWQETLFAKGEGNSENWITLTSYGEGAKPKIAPGNHATYCIFLDNYAGWRFINLEVSDAQAGIRALISKNPEIKHDGLWFEKLYVHDIENAPPNPYYKEPGLYMSYGISTFKVLGRGLSPFSNVTMKDCFIENTDAPVTFASIDNLVIDNVEMKNSYKEGILFSQINEAKGSSGYMRNCRVLHTGYPKGMYWGVAGVQFNSTRNFEMYDCEIAYTRNSGFPDGCGIDFEGNNVDVTVRNNYIHDNEGCGVMIYKNTTWGTDNVRTNIIDNVFEYNGLKDLDGSEAFLRHKFNKENGGIISGNKIKAFEGQPVITVEENALEVKIKDGIMMGDYPNSYQAEGNTVEFVPYGKYADYSMLEPAVKTNIVKKWDFDEGDEGWTVKQGMTAFEWADGELSSIIISKDPFFFSPDNLGIDINKNTVIILRMRQTTGRPQMKVYFTTPESQSWEEAKSNAAALIDNNGEYVEYYIDMQYIDTWRGTLKQLRIDPTDNSGAQGEMAVDYIYIGENLEKLRTVYDNSAPPVTVLEPIKSSVSAVSKEYGWDFDTDSEGWAENKNGAIKNLAAEGGSLRGDITARDPYIMSADNLGYDIDGMRYVAVRFLNDTSRSNAKIYFSTEEETSFSDDKAVSVETAAYDTQHRLYIFDMKKNAKWKGRLKRLRFDMIDNVDGVTGTFDIDYIYIGNETEAKEESIILPSDIGRHWAAKEMEFMIRCCAAEAYDDGLFRPEQPVTRAEAAVMTARALKLKPAVYNGRFKDVQIGADGCDDIERAANAGIMQGYGDVFAPDKLLSRQEAAVIITGCMELLGGRVELGAETFPDNGSIAPWARKAVSKAVGEQIISGMPDGEFKPEAPLTRAQLCTLLYRIIEWSRDERRI